MTRYDVIVLGTGGVGSAATYHAARRGLKTLGIDRHHPPHDRGSSHGQTRVIRQAYFEHPDYVPLVLRAYELWRDLERETGQELLTVTGLLQAGPGAGSVLAGVRASARQHGLAVEELSASAAALQFPGVRIPDDWSCAFEPAAGYLRVEQCVEAHLSAAQRHGAELIFDEPVCSWQPDGAGVCLRTERQTLYADRLIVAAGPWAASLLANLGVPLVVRRKPLFWYATQGDQYRADRGFPCFLFERPEGIFYGFPELSAADGASGRLKLAEHTGGRTVDDPAAVDRDIDHGERQRVERFLAQHLPGVSRRMVDHRVCLYTMSPDEHFLLDRVPACPQAAFAAGLSGHGFKFASVLGEALVDVACDGASSAPVEFLGLSRLGLRG